MQGSKEWFASTLQVTSSTNSLICNGMACLGVACDHVLHGHDFVNILSLAQATVYKINSSRFEASFMLQ